MCLSVKEDFADLRYYRSAKGQEYAVLSDIIGGILILDITNYSEEWILHCIAEVVCGRTPKNAITDKAEMLKIARLFR